MGTEAFSVSPRGHLAGFFVQPFAKTQTYSVHLHMRGIKAASSHTREPGTEEDFGNLAS